MNKKVWLWLFVAVAIAELCGEFLNNQIIIYCTKPLLMIVLSLYYYFSTKEKKSKFSRLILLGLVFSIGGDTFLMFKGSNYFIAGLGCFLITHILYIAAFQNYKSSQIGFLREKWWIITPFLIYLFGLLQYLWNDLADMMIPVIVYSAVICTMAIATLNLKNKMPKVIFSILFVGVLLFMFSDSVIALNKFKSAMLDIPFPNLIIMVTYITAQYLIASSTIIMNEEL